MGRGPFDFAVPDSLGMHPVIHLIQSGGSVRSLAPLPPFDLRPTPHALCSFPPDII